MTIHDYIKKHKLRRIGRWPATNLHVDEVLVEPSSDKFELYRNSKSTHFVSFNLTKAKFCILHSELVPCVSDWCSIDLDNENDTQ